MIYVDKQIRDNLFRFVMETEQPELEHIINYCLGYYGYVTKQIWRAICDLKNEGIIKF